MGVSEKDVIFTEKIVFHFDEAYRISLDTLKLHAPSSEYAGPGSVDTPLPPPVPVIADNRSPFCNARWRG